MLYLLSVLLLVTAVAGDSNDTCAAQTCQGIPPKFQGLPGMRIRACQEAGHDYCPIYKVNVLSDSHCWKLCESLTSCCRLFTYNAKSGHCYIYDQDFYTSWTSVDVSDGNWTSYYLQREDGWKLLYKISKGISVDILDTYTKYPGQPIASQNLLGTDASCQCYVKSQVVDYWSKFPITQVSVSLAAAGKIVKYVTMSSIGETSTSFYKRQNIVSSSWTDLAAWSQVSIMSMTEMQYQRSFLIIKTPYAGCENDLGWISVYSRLGPTCNYDTAPVPAIAYSPGPTADKFYKNASFADALMIYAKM